MKVRRDNVPWWVAHATQYRPMYLVIAMSVTAVALAWTVLGVSRAIRVSTQLDRFRSTSEQLERALLAASQERTYSARSFTVTNDEQDTARWRDAFAQEMRALREASQALPLHPKVVQKVAEATARVAAIEEQALALVRRGQARSAVELLNGLEYLEVRRHLRESLADLQGEIQLQRHRLQVAREHAVRLERFALALAVLVIFVVWGLVLQNMRRWRSSLLEALRALRESEDRFRRAVQGATDAIWDWDAASNTIYLSPRYMEMLGEAEAETRAMLRAILKRVHLEDRRAIWDALAAHLRGSAIYFESEFRLLDCRGEWRWMLARGLAVRDANQKPYRMAGSLSDITRRKLAEEELHRGAYHDPLTGLPNRRYFQQEVERCTAKVTRQPEYCFALLFVDLDGFKKINDAFGHRAGDEVLRVVARRLRTCLRPQDIVARVGGDEFVVLLDDVVGLETPTLIAQRIEAEISQPAEISGNHVRVSASIGVALSRDHGTDPDKLLAVADADMYRAKVERRAESARPAQPYEYGGGL